MHMQHIQNIEITIKENIYSDFLPCAWWIFAVIITLPQTANHPVDFPVNIIQFQPHCKLIRRKYTGS